MKVLILGSGGREHALAWKISQSNQLKNLFIAPGNGGTARAGKNLPINIQDFNKVKETVLDHNIDMVIVGPEQPLVDGIVNYFKNDDKLSAIPVIGPDETGARLEGSKEFANNFMRKYNIPTADFKSFSLENMSQGFDFLESLNPPYVLKSDGLAAGKGVIITEDIVVAKKNLKELLEGKFGEASKKVVIEEFLEGKELSAFILTDGTDYQLLPLAKDYKRAGEKDTGLNTGGMGALTPVPYADEKFILKLKENIIKPTLEGLKLEGIDYKGFLYFGLMKVKGEPYVIEYNVRMGDPETQPVLTLVKSDLLELLKAVHSGELGKKEIEIYDSVAAAVILASEGYPEAYEKGKQITIPDDLEEVTVFHAGTNASDEKLFTSGGRVMAVASKGSNFDEVFRKIYDNIEKIDFEGKYYRKDIGYDI